MDRGIANQGVTRPGSPLSRALDHKLSREFVALALLVIAFIVGSRLSAHFLDATYLLNTTSLYIETGIMALAMTFIIVSGNIDLSVASTLALVACVTGVLHSERGMAMGLALVCGLLLGALLGFLNGLLITGLRLPSLTVTLGTFALYRGLAQRLLGDHSASGFPAWFKGIDTVHIAGTPLPAPLVIFLVLALVLGLVLHRTVLGRWTYAIGTNPTASRYSGIAVDRVVLLLFTLSGLLSGLCGLMMMSRVTMAKYDLGLGLELDAITAVVLGGTDIFGGRGTIFGTVITFFLIVILRSAMGLRSIKPEQQMLVIGLLLIFSIVLPNLVQRSKQ